MPEPAGEVLLVSSGLDRDGGGTAVVGRLIAAAAAEYCAGRGLSLQVLQLGRERAPCDPPLPPGEALRAFAGNRRALAAAVAWRHLAGRPAAAVFDHLGPARIAALIPPFRRSPYLVFLHGVEVWRPLGAQRRRALAGARLLLANSQLTRDRALPFLPPDLPPLAVLPLALEEREASGESDAALLSAAGEGFFLMVGRMAREEGYKGHAEVLAAWPALLASHPRARLVVAGGGDDRGRLEALAGRQGLAGAVTFTGFVSEATLAELYRRCLALVLPSRNEGFGLVYLEAMRAGKAVIAARGSAAEEIVADGETGLLVDPGRPQELAAALASLLADPTRARDLGRAGEERWRSRFSLALFRRRLHGHLEALLAAGRPGPGRDPG